MHRQIVLLLLISLCSCNYAEKWKQQQIAQSSSIAQGQQITPPAAPAKSAKDLADDLPVDAAWQVYEYSESGGTVSVKLLTSSGAEATTLWLHERLTAMGYSSGDNLSRLLEGAAYSGDGKYKSIWAKVGLNNSEQVTVELRGS